MILNGCLLKFLISLCGYRRYKWAQFKLNNDKNEA